MTLEQQLRHLEDQRDAKWHRAANELAHWKHDLRRAVSPARLIRKHMGISLLLAGLLGMLIAPPLRSGRTNHSPARRHRLAHLWRLAQRLLPQLRGMAGTKATENGGEAAAKISPEISNHHGTGLTDLLRDFVLPLLARLDWQAITAAWLAGISHRPTPATSVAAESARPVNAPAEPQPATTRPRPPGDERNEDVDIWSG